MTLFLATLLVTLLCCVAMAVGVLLGGRPLAGGCRGGAHRCLDCPNRSARTEGIEGE